MVHERKPRGRARRAQILIVDDHDLARAGVRTLLRSARNLEVVGEASSGHEALCLCRALHPDLVLMDVRLADMDGLRATRSIKQAAPDIRVLLFTMYEAADYIAESLRAGAAGYVLKGASRQELLEAINRALQSEP
jgi:DNA-binding NarL/FixJ family response regulator